jgi:hypothetical protein
MKNDMNDEQFKKLLGKFEVEKEYENDCKLMYQLGNDKNKDHAFFYKITERDGWLQKKKNGENSYLYFSFNSKEELEDAKKQGKVYNPFDKRCKKDIHIWDKNLFWLLGLLHGGCKVTLLSRCIIPNFIQSRYYRELPKNLRGERQLPGDGTLKKKEAIFFSAFAREIAVLLKVGYFVKIDSNNSIILFPPENKDNLKKLTIFDIDPSTKEVISHLKTVLGVIFSKIKDEHNSLANYITECLKENSELLTEYDEEEREEDVMDDEEKLKKLKYSGYIDELSYRSTEDLELNVLLGIMTTLFNQEHNCFFIYPELRGILKIQIEEKNELENLKEKTYEKIEIKSNEKDENVLVIEETKFNPNDTKNNDGNTNNINTSLNNN